MIPFRAIFPTSCEGLERSASRNVKARPVFHSRRCRNTVFDTSVMEDGSSPGRGAGLHGCRCAWLRRRRRRSSSMSAVRGGRSTRRCVVSRVDKSGYTNGVYRARLGPSNCRLDNDSEASVYRRRRRGRSSSSVVSSSTNGRSRSSTRARTCASSSVTVRTRAGSSSTRTRANSSTPASSAR